MTLLAFHVRGDQVDVLTDTMTVEPGRRDLGRLTKCDTVPHLEMAIAGHGQYALHYAMRNAVVANTDRLALDFDGVVVAAREWLTSTWRGLNDPFPTRLLLFGWSPRGKRFTGHRLTWSDEGFASETLDDRFECWPEPPAPLAAAPPADDSSWVELGRRTQWCWMPPQSERVVPIGGDLWLTTLNRGVIAQRRIATLDDSAWTAIAAGGLLNQPAHLLTSPASNPDGLVARSDGSGAPRVPRNAPCPCGSGRKSKHCCGP